MGVLKDDDGDGPLPAWGQGWQQIAVGLALDCGRCNHIRFRWISASLYASQDVAGHQAGISFTKLFLFGFYGG